MIGSGIAKNVNEMVEIVIKDDLPGLQAKGYNNNVGMSVDGSPTPSNYEEPRPMSQLKREIERLNQSSLCSDQHIPGDSTMNQSPYQPEEALSH